ncbi:MAG: hypothetical protein ABR608_03015 [Pseudonocardiaceae bacterium]
MRRWRQVQQAMRRYTGLLPTLMPLLLGSGLLVLVLVLLLTSRRPHRRLVAVRLRCRCV